MTLCGRLALAARSAIGIDDVLLAQMQSAEVCASTAASTSCFTVTSSGTDSITHAALAMSAYRAVTWTLRRPASASATLRRPCLTSEAYQRRIRSLARSTPPRRGATTTVVAPNPDSRRASPEPIAPAPTMPTRSVRSSVRPVLQVVVPLVRHRTPGHAGTNRRHDQPVTVLELSVTPGLIQGDGDRGGHEISGVRVCDDELRHLQLEAPSQGAQNIDRGLVRHDPVDVLEGQPRALDGVERAEREAVHAPGVDLRKLELPVVEPLVQDFLRERLLPRAAWHPDVLAKVSVRAGGERPDTVAVVQALVVQHHGGGAVAEYGERHEHFRITQAGRSVRADDQRCLIPPRVEEAGRHEQTVYEPAAGRVKLNDLGLRAELGLQRERRLGETVVVGKGGQDDQVNVPLVEPRVI